MRRLWFRLWFCLWPFFLGVGLPYVNSDGHGLLNFFWSAIFGLGLWVLDLTGRLYIDSPFLVVGVLVWPVAVCLVMWALGRYLTDGSHRKLKLIAAIGLIASSFLVIPIGSEGEPPFSKLPIYGRLFAAVW